MVVLREEFATCAFSFYVDIPKYVSEEGQGPRRAVKPVMMMMMIPKYIRNFNICTCKKILRH
jgi:hypothetical protein